MAAQDAIATVAPTVMWHECADELIFKDDPTKDYMFGQGMSHHMFVYESNSILILP